MAEQAVKRTNHSSKCYALVNVMTCIEATQHGAIAFAHKTMLIE